MLRMPERSIEGPARNFVGYGREMPRVVRPEDARNEAILGGMALGLEAKYRDLALESVYEHGSRAGIWRLQRLFDARGVPVTVFAGAVAVERNPEVAA